MDVEIVDPGGGSKNIAAVARGEADFTLTSVVRHYFNARIEFGEFPARFVAMVVQRNPLAVFVPEDSPCEKLSDLAGRSLATEVGSPHADEVPALFAELGLAAPRLVPCESAPAAVGRRDVDGMIGFLDGLPRNRRRAGVPLRGFPLDNQIYASGLLASDRLSEEAVWSMRTAMVAALERQRAQPEAGLEEYCRRYPETVPEEALEGWELVKPYVFTGVEPGFMADGQLEDTIGYAAGVRQVPAPPAATVYRPEFAHREDGG